MRGEQIK